MEIHNISSSMKRIQEDLGNQYLRDIKKERLSETSRARYQIHFDATVKAIDKFKEMQEVFMALRFSMT